VNLDSNLRRKITVIVLAALTFLASWAIHRFLKSHGSEAKPSNPLTKKEVEEPVDKLNEVLIKKMDNQNEERLNPHWINDHPTTSLWDLGLDNFEKLIDFIKKYGVQLISLNLKLLDIKDKEFKELVSYTSNIRCLSLSSLNMTDSALEHLQGLPLKSVEFSNCKELTDDALSHLKGMPLIVVSFSGCDKLTNDALRHFQGMPLISIFL